MGQKLTADELGIVGESRFSTLCSQAKLVCNKSTRDVTGWDFLVEFPISDHDDPVTLDQRQSTSCLVQLKSTADVDKGRVSLRLSAIERLAKNPHPAVVVVFHLTPDGEPIAGYLIHLLDKPLARVLKRLRTAEAENARAVNHTTITFDYRKLGTHFNPTPQGLRAALAGACGDNPARYVTEKQRQLAELGYESGRLEVQAILSIEDPDHLNDVLLGLTPVKPERLRVFDSRFGIRIPYSGPLLAELDELRFAPPHIGTCEISFRGPALAPAVVFTCEAHIGPPIPGIGGFDILIRHLDFFVRLRSDGLHLETTNVETSPRPLHRWIPLLRALSYIAGGEANITIVGLGSMPKLTLPWDSCVDGPDVEHLPRLTRFVDGWQRLLDTAGVKSTAALSLSDIWNASSAEIAVDMLLNPTPIARLEFQGIEDVGSAEPLEALIVGTCRIADAAVSYSAKVALQAINETPGDYRSSAFTILDLQPAVDDEAAYSEEQCVRHGLRISINQKHLQLEHTHLRNQ